MLFAVANRFFDGVGVVGEFIVQKNGGCYAERKYANHND